MRSEIVRTALAMVERGLVVDTQGNVSARDGDRIFITPAALPYDVMTPDDIVELDQPHMHPPSSEWRVHAAIYRARPDVRAIVHTHSPQATAWSHRETDLSAAVRTARWAEAGVAELGTHCVDALGPRDAVLLARHGVVGVGATLAEALEVCQRVEELARGA